jgi:hypothetical protein
MRRCGSRTPAAPTAQWNSTCNCTDPTQLASKESTQNDLIQYHLVNFLINKSYCLYCPALSLEKVLILSPHRRTHRPRVQPPPPPIYIRNVGGKPGVKPEPTSQDD